MPTIAGVMSNSSSKSIPSNDMEAFLTSGRPRFDIPTLLRYRERCENGSTGFLERHGKGVTFAPDAKGYLEVWEHPKKGDYYIGVDVAKNQDYSCAVVYDEDKNMVAMWRGHIDPDRFGDPELIKLGEWYNYALIAIEENNHGLSTINAMKHSYDNLYKRTRYDKATDKESEELGWYTSVKTKPLAIDNLAKLIRELVIGTKSRRFIDECITYVIGEKGDTNAQEGCFDDTVMASAIILFVMDGYTQTVGDIVVAGSREQPVYDGTFRHPSEIEDERYSDEDGDWFRKAGW